MNIEALWLSVKLASMTSLILLSVGLPLAYWIATASWRWKFFIEALAALPMILPPTVLGFYLLWTMAPIGPMGRLYETLFGAPLTFSFIGLLIGSVVYSFPFALQPLVVSFRGVDARFLKLAAVLGDAPLMRFFKIVLPLSYRGILSAFIMAFAHTIGEFGVVLMIGGNIPGVTRTISIDLYDQVQALNYEGAGETALFLLASSFFFLAWVYYLNREKVGGTYR